MRGAKGTLRLTATGRDYAVEVRPRDRDSGVELQIHRDDSKGVPTVRLSLDDALILGRALQAAHDRAHQRAREEHRKAKADAEFNRILDSVAKAIGVPNA